MNLFEKIRIKKCQPKTRITEVMTFLVIKSIHLKKVVIETIGTAVILYKVMIKSRDKMNSFTSVVHRVFALNNDSNASASFDVVPITTQKFCFLLLRRKIAQMMFLINLRKCKPSNFFAGFLIGKISANLVTLSIEKFRRAARRRNDQTGFFNGPSSASF